MERGSSASSLDEQFERLIVKGISMDADGPKPRSDIITRLGRLEPAKGQSEASREVKARLVPNCSRGSRESSPTRSRLKGAPVSVRAQVNSLTSSSADAERFCASSSTSSGQQ